jgi:aspartate kinase
MNFKVVKFGGTSVGSPDRMKEVARLINTDEPKIVVLSAVAGTTNKLVAIASLLHKKQVEEATTAINELHEEYKNFVNSFYAQKATLEKATNFIQAHFEYIRAFTQDMFTIHEENAILAQGELLSTGLFHLYLQEENINSALISALEFMRVDKDHEPDEFYIKSNLRKELEKHPNTKLFITQGYICRNIFGEISNLQRGGSDYSASIIGAAAEASQIEIWTDIDGMHNNDPRIVPNTKPVRKLSFEEAAELAYFGAKILHPASVHPAQKANIRVLLKNTMEPQAEGTVISSDHKSKGITAIAAKDGITVIKIRSGRMLMAYGFLRKVFEVFERYKTPIDMITTSEVAVSLTIDNPTRINEIVAELSSFGSVEVDDNQSIICVVGDMLAENKGYAFRVFESLKEISIRMISYGGSKNNVSFVVNNRDKNEALIALHHGIFTTETEPA